MRKLQIGVVGGYSDLGESAEYEPIARELGQKIAAAGGVLVVGGEKNGGVTKAAAEGARKSGGLVVGIMPDKLNAATWVDVVIECGGKYGLREYLLPLSCDALIVVNGGSGTLNEIAVAYQNNIPVIALSKTGGWAAKLSGEYVDNRKRAKVIPASSPEEAVRLAIQEVRSK